MNGSSFKGTGRLDAIDDETQLTELASHYRAEQLHERSKNAWAVIAMPQGAIVADRDGRLLMRMERTQAEALAAAMTTALKTDATRAGL
jgi:predicted FMN-binding regulatory protein PaiB